MQQEIDKKASGQAIASEGNKKFAMVPKSSLQGTISTYNKARVNSDEESNRMVSSDSEAEFLNSESVHYATRATTSNLQANKGASDSGKGAQDSRKVILIDDHSDQEDLAANDSQTIGHNERNNIGMTHNKPSDSESDVDWEEEIEELEVDTEIEGAIAAGIARFVKKVDNDIDINKNNMSSSSSSDQMNSNLDNDVAERVASGTSDIVTESRLQKDGFVGDSKVLKTEPVSDSTSSDTPKTSTLLQPNSSETDAFTKLGDCALSVEVASSISTAMEAAYVPDIRASIGNSTHKFVNSVVDDLGSVVPSIESLNSNKHQAESLSHALTITDDDYIDRAISMANGMGDWAGKAVRRVLKDHAATLKDTERSDNKGGIVVKSKVSATSDTPLEHVTRDEKSEQSDQISSFATSSLQEDSTDPVSALLEEDVDYASQYRKSMRDAESMTEEMKEEVLQLLQAFDLPYIIAPFEAEAQCAVLEQVNLITYL